MSILIKTDNKQLRLKLTENEESKLFMELMQTALGFNFGTRELKHTSKPAEQIPETFPELTVKPQESNTEESGYKGFLLMECKHCGKIKAFCAKEKINKYFCSDCGETTEFENPLVKLYMNCKCGRISTYWTNITTDIMDVTCIECGAPVPVKYNGKKNIYETLR